MGSTRLIDELSILMQHPAAFYSEVIKNSGRDSYTNFVVKPRPRTPVTDSRVKDWLWMQSPIPTLVLCLLYLLCVAVGPKLMENRKAFELKHLLIVYNFSLVVLSVYIVYQVSLACI